MTKRQPTNPIAGDPDFVKKFVARFRRNTGQGRRNYFRRASNELTRRNDQFRNDTILTLPQQTPETGLEHDRSIDLRHRFREQGDNNA